jgi:hypothetical protein
MLLEMVGGSLLAVAMVTSAAAGTMYRWTAADGSVAYTDDPKRIPAQYRSEAVRTRSGDLESYPRYTPARSSARAQQAERAERVERLRAINAGVHAAAEPAALATPNAGQMILELNERSSIVIPNDQLAGEEPVVVEQVRVRDRNNISTTHVTVVRQGDRILSVVRPESAHDRADWVSESELLELEKDE